MKLFAVMQSILVTDSLPDPTPERPLGCLDLILC